MAIHVHVRVRVHVHVCVHVHVRVHVRVRVRVRVHVRMHLHVPACSRSRSLASNECSCTGCYSHRSDGRDYTWESLRIRTTSASGRCVARMNVGHAYLLTS